MHAHRAEGNEENYETMLLIISERKTTASATCIGLVSGASSACTVCTNCWNHSLTARSLFFWQQLPVLYFFSSTALRCLVLTGCRRARPTFDDDDDIAMVVHSSLYTCLSRVIVANIHPYPHVHVYRTHIQKPSNATTVKSIFSCQFSKYNLSISK